MLQSENSLMQTFAKYIFHIFRARIEQRDLMMVMIL